MNGPTNKDARQEAFLVSLRSHGTVMAACRASGVPKATQRYWRETDEAFVERFDEAMEEFSASLMEEALRRGRDGWHEPIIWQGSQAFARDPKTGDLKLDDDFEPIPLSTLRKSDRILERLLEAKVEGFARKGTLELSGPGGGAIPTKTEIVLVESDGEGRPLQKHNSSE